MKRLLIASLLGAIAFSASAQYATPTQVDPKTKAKIAADAQTNKDAQRNCLRYTGTRIPASKLGSKGCVMANGRVYSREDIDRTGEVDIADALRKLDPSIR